jgi:periplasmic protein TonB
MNGLEFTGTQVGLAVLGFVILTVLTIFLFRNYFKKQAEVLTEKYKDKVWSSPLKARTKYPEVDSFSFYKPFLLWGGLVATGSTLFALNWTQFEEKQNFTIETVALDEEIEIEPPRTAEPPPPPPPPPPPVISEVPDDEIIEEPPKFEDQSIDEKTEVVEKPVEAPKVESKAAPPPPPPPPPPPAKEEIFKVVEQMPRFPGCEKMDGDNKKKAECATEKLMKYLGENVKYPAIARENGIEGTATIQFTVGKAGEIEDITILREPGAGIGEAAKEAVESMNKMKEKWTPGKQRGVPVKVQFTVPLKFKLNS